MQTAQRLPSTLGGLVCKGVGVAAADGRKRSVRGGESEDGFTALLDFVPKTLPGTGTDARDDQRVEQTINVAGSQGNRVFHLLGIYDGHRSHHAARYCATALAPELAKRLSGALQNQDPASGEGGALKEESDICKALEDAVVKVDEDFCRIR